MNKCLYDNTSLTGGGHWHDTDEFLPTLASWCSLSFFFRLKPTGQEAGKCSQIKRAMDVDGHQAQANWWQWYFRLLLPRRPTDRREWCCRCCCVVGGLRRGGGGGGGGGGGRGGGVYCCRCTSSTFAPSFFLTYFIPLIFLQISPFFLFFSLPSAPQLLNAIHLQGYVDRRYFQLYSVPSRICHFSPWLGRRTHAFTTSTVELSIYLAISGRNWILNINSL